MTTRSIRRALLAGLSTIPLFGSQSCGGVPDRSEAQVDDVRVGTTAEALNVAAPPGMGNYCSITWPNGGWSFASDTNGGDPCTWILNQSPGGTIQRKGLYANNDWNRVVYRCYPPNYGWVGIYEGWGNGPLTAAFNAAEGKPGCVFVASPKSMPIFNSPFPLSTPSYVHNTGFDFDRADIAFHAGAERKIGRAGEYQIEPLVGPIRAGLPKVGESDVTPTLQPVELHRASGQRNAVGFCDG
jgi:hypothetical protein